MQDEDIVKYITDLEPFLEESERRVLKALSASDWEVLIKILQQYSEYGSSTVHENLYSKDFIRKPVSIIEFVNSSYYVGDIAGELYQEIQDRLKEIYSRDSVVEILLSGCFTGDTKILLCDGRRASFEELYRSQEKNLRVYSYNKMEGSKRSISKEGVILTRYTSRLVEIILNTGDRIKCTLGHEWMLLDGMYKAAAELRKGDKLAYDFLSSNSLRVVSTRYLKLKELVPVYCVEVEDKDHNFTLNSGAVVKNSIGWGKSWTARVLALYQLYWLSCLRNPQEYLGIAKVSQIMLCNISITGGKSDEFFSELRNALDTSDYFKENFPRLKRINSVLMFPNFVSFISAGSQQSGIIGCFTGNTELMVEVEGKHENISFTELEKNYKNRKFKVVSWDGLKKESVVLEAHSPRITKNTSILHRVILETGEEVDCTPDHLWMLENGTYEEASKLKKGDKLKSNTGVVEVLDSGWLYVPNSPPVYDLTVEGTHNFALSSGVFVHNSNILFAIMDEANFMQVSSNSVKKMPGTEEYNQAMELYRAIRSRIKSRFMFYGRSLGKVVIVSSKRYPDDFLEKHIEKSKNFPDVAILSYATWDTKPAHMFSGEWFYIYKGGKDEIAKPRILEPGEESSYSVEEIIKVPMEYKPDFELDMMQNLRDTAGIAILGTSLFMDTEKVANIFKPELPLPANILETNFSDGFELNLDLLLNKDEEGKYSGPIIYPNAERFIHVDFSKNNDSTGFAMGCLVGHKEIVRLRDGVRTVEMMPVIHIDIAIGVYKDLILGEVSQSEIRSLVERLKELGYRIRKVSTDSYQSLGFRQLLTEKGFTTEEISLDRTPEGYMKLRENIMTDTIQCHNHPKLKKELASLTRDKQTNKVDHPMNGSKDISDSVAGITMCIYKDCPYLEDLFPTTTEVKVTHTGKTIEEKMVNREFMETSLEDIEDENDRFAREVYM